MSANRLFRADAAAFCAKREDNLSHAASRQALLVHATSITLESLPAPLVIVHLLNKDTDSRSRSVVVYHGYVHHAAGKSR